MEITRRLKLFAVSAIIVLLISVDSGVISAPAGTLSKRSIGSDILCDACSDIASVLRKLVKEHVAEEVIVATAIELCEQFKIEDNYICKNMVPEFKVIKHCVLYI